MKKKLTSRKFWLAVAGLITAILVIFGVEDIKIEQVCTLIGALATLCAYIFAEGYADAKNSENSDTAPAENEKNEK